MDLQCGSYTAVIFFFFFFALADWSSKVLSAGLLIALALELEKLLLDVNIWSLSRGLKGVVVHCKNCKLQCKNMIFFFPHSSHCSIYDDGSTPYNVRMWISSGSMCYCATGPLYFHGSHTADLFFLRYPPTLGSNEPSHIILRGVMNVLASTLETALKVEIEAFKLQWGEKKKR